MKTITMILDDSIFEELKREASLLSFTEGCCSPPSLMERIMHGLVLKMEKGEKEMTVIKAHRECRP